MTEHGQVSDTMAVCWSLCVGGVDSPVVNFSGAFSYHVVQSHIRISKILMVKWEFSHVIFFAALHRKRLHFDVMHL